MTTTPTESTKTNKPAVDVFEYLRGAMDEILRLHDEAKVLRKERDDAVVALLAHEQGETDG